MAVSAGTASDGRRPTMRDVAALAQVSFTTVLRWVNCEAGVSPALDARVPAGDDQAYLETELRAGTAIVCVDREIRPPR